MVGIFFPLSHTEYKHRERMVHKNFFNIVKKKIDFTSIFNRHQKREEKNFLISVTWKKNGTQRFKKKNFAEKKINEKIFEER